MIKLTHGFYLCNFCNEMTRLQDYYFENQFLVGDCEDCGEKIEVRLFKPRYSFKIIIKPPKPLKDVYAEQNPAVTKSKGEKSA